MAQPPLRPQDAVMLIPSLEPDDRLPAYVRRLLDKGFQHVVIVDDGSSATYQPIFAELDAMDGVSMLYKSMSCFPPEYGRTRTAPDCPFQTNILCTAIRMHFLHSPHTDRGGSDADRLPG